MKLGYDIFQKLEDVRPLLIANVQTPAQALQKVIALRHSASARYFVRDAETGVLINDCGPGAVGSIDEGGVRTKLHFVMGSRPFLKAGRAGFECL
jgi:hypothetical protein